MPKEEVKKVRVLTRWERLGVASLFVVGALILTGIVFVFSGIYNIGASREHWSATNSIITILRDRSIAVASSGIDVPNLNDPDLFVLGAQHYLSACNSCHGNPGEPLNPVYRNMLPRPPNLVGAFNDYDARELFWIVYNGLKYTGMPAWPGQDRTDEVWSVVAYLAQIREPVEPGGAPSALRSSLIQDVNNAAALPLTNCVRCHGDGQSGTVSALVPTLYGLAAPYLERALAEYQSEVRASGIMAPVAHAMSQEEIEGFASYYSSLSVPPQNATASPDLLEQGRRIAEHGIAEQDVPACNTCHNGVDPQVPQLQGQSARYMATQLDLWRETQHRSASAYGSLMATVGRRLTADDAAAVSAWYQTQQLPEGAMP